MLTQQLKWNINIIQNWGKGSGGFSLKRIFAHAHGPTPLLKLLHHGL